MNADAGPAPWHTVTAGDAVERLTTEPSAGLTSAEAGRRLIRHGPNALREVEARTLLAVFVGQFTSPLIYLLLVASGVALALGHTTDAIVIAVVVVVNAVIGSAQEGRAERSLAALRKLATNQARIVRDHREHLIAARDVVPGDVLLVEAGDAIAADARLLEVAALHVAEAALTGESVPVSKSTSPVELDTPLADRRNMIYAGTHVTAGRARAVIVETGATTEIGQVAEMAQAAKEPQTPLERRVAQFGRFVIVIAIVLFALVNLTGLLRGVAFGEILMISISTVVGMIPEGLPVAMTIALAVGVQRMARRGAVVRRLAAVETLGSTTVICSDKTGTLTRNEMTVTSIVLADGRALEVTGPGYEPRGELLEDGRTIAAGADPAVVAVLEAGALCNDARLQAPDDQRPTWTPIGDPTELALLTVAIKGGVELEALRAAAPRRAELPFDPDAKLMATEHDTAAGPRVMLKGAPEELIALCGAARHGDGDRPLDDEARDRLRAAADRMASRALRVLAVAVIEGGELDVDAGFSGLRGRAVLLGMLGQLDPPRAEVRDAVERCRQAGIRTVMVTGDHKATGQAIAHALDIAHDGDAAVDGRELAALSDAELVARIDQITVFARVHPAQKLRIVDAFQQRGEVVAMTGDGVNDAPALAKADVGVAMGITGTEVAKDASKIVVTDDNFTTIVAAVEEGRVVYRNIKKAILLLFSTAASEVLVLLLAMMLGYPPPFVAVQILWNNLVTEGLITVNLIMEPAEGDEMSQRPVDRDEPLLSRLLVTRMAFMVPAIVVASLGWFVVRMGQGVPEIQVRTETFTLLAICEWFNVLNCRSATRSALTFAVLRNPWLVGGLVLGNLLQIAVVFWAPMNEVFHTVPFGFDIVIALAAVGSLVLWVEELRKWFVRRRLKRAHDGT